MKVIRTDAEIECPLIDASLQERGIDLVLLPDGVSEERLAREARESSKNHIVPVARDEEMM